MKSVPEVSETMSAITAQNFAVTCIITFVAGVVWKVTSHWRLEGKLPFTIPGGSYITGHLMEIGSYKGRNFCAFAIDKAPPGK